jgi:hypothetical protein
MSNVDSLPIRIEIFALWTGFASPPHVSGHLVLRPEENGDWTAFDEMTLAQSTVPQERVVRFMNAIDDIATEPEPVRFGRTADELDWHFGGCTTDDSPTMLVELHFDDRKSVRMRTSSNHAHLLPWTFEGNDRSDNFNPEISIATATLLPDGWMFKERLQSSEHIFDSEKEIRAEFAKQDQECVDQPNETPEQQMARVTAALNEMANAIAHGEEVEFAKGKRDYTANQLRRLSATELSELAADGFDLSTSDETGQTALMLAAFPPFSRDQFEKLVAVGADVNARRADSMTGLMLACAGGMEDSVPFWLDAGAKVNLRGPNGCTAIMLGATYPTIVQRLLERGADVAAADNDGDTALDYAIDDRSILRAGDRLQSIGLLAREIGRVAVSSLKRSLDRAIEIARKTRVHRHVLMSLGMHPMSVDDFIDVEITEIELTDRIVAFLREAVAEAGSSSSNGQA